MVERIGETEGNDMQTVRAIVLVSVFALVFALIIVLIVSILPHLDMIGKVASWVVVDALICAGVLIAFGTFFFLRWLWYNSSVVRRGDVIIMRTAAGYEHLSAKHEAAKLALPAPTTTVTEERVVSAEDRDVIDRSRVLALHFDEGMGMHAIERKLGLPYNKVRDWCNTADALREKQQSW